MRQLNKTAAEVMEQFPVNACTDVTGYGFLGHLMEMTRGSGMDIAIDPARVPFMEGVEQLAINGIIPGGTRNNLDFVSGQIVWGHTQADHLRLMLCDAQTSGGLLIAIPDEHANDFLSALRDAGLSESQMVGRVVGKGVGKIYLKSF